MPTAIRHIACSFSCALLLLLPVQPASAAAPAIDASEAQSGQTTAAALQTEFLRRINQAESVASLFSPQAVVPDFASVRAITLLPEKAAGGAKPLPGTDRLWVRLPVRLRLQAPFSADCPVVDEHLAQIGENTKTWDESGWLALTFQHTSTGWLIAELQYRPAE